MSADREAAAAVLPPEVLHYYDGWTGDGQTGAEATPAWRSYRLRPRVLRAVADVDTRVRVGGVDLALPLLAAPAALHGLAHPDAERASVAGVVAAGGLPVLSARSSLGLEDIGLPPGRWWQQLYVCVDRGIARDLAVRAREHGAAALVVTGDAPVLATRRAGKETLPPEVLRSAPGLAKRPGAEQAADASLADAVELAARAGLPFWVKGVLRADDALLAVDAGAAGVVVSNHGGRQLDGAVATAHAVREVAEAVGDRAEVVVDGGVRSGRDVLTALALGARAVAVARPLLWALAVGGADGVRAEVERLGTELVEVMRLCGAPSLAEVTPDLVH